MAQVPRVLAVPGTSTRNYRAVQGRVPSEASVSRPAPAVVTWSGAFTAHAVSVGRGVADRWGPYGRWIVKARVRAGNIR